ncbi:hypothetical protein HW49_00030 [Porphyromonadaceae bacterium COT-184 OH4590]|nr:hypothetical protein HW49_00030 [Porphyromonadaceae bacterium COT-184 OH4590]
MVFLRKFNTFIEKNNLLDLNKNLLVAVSGGIDSVVLLDILIRAGYKCSIAHCNFHLRGNDSDQDENFVKRLAKKYDIPIFIEHFDTTKKAMSEKISIEMAARNLRYKWFEEVVQTHNFQAIAIAHHKNDSAETVLLNLARGTGLRGLTGINARRKNIVRPMLCFDRSEVELYAQMHKLNFCIDHTNTDTTFHRNRVRHNILPEFQKINKNFVSQIETFSQIIGEYNAFFDKEIKKYVSKIADFKPNDTEIDIPLLQQSGFAKIILFEITQRLNLPTSLFKEIYRLTESQSGKKIVCRDVNIIKNRDKLLILNNIPKHEQTYKITRQLDNIDQPIPLRFQVIDIQHLKSIKCDKKMALLDYDRLTFPLTIRTWQYGDRFKPLGVKGFKKLSDFFINQKVDIASKHNTFILLEGNNQIVWVINHRIDERFSITDATKKVLKINTI